MPKYIDKEKLLEKLEALRHEPWMEYNAILGILLAEEVVKQFEEILSPISYCGSKEDEDTVIHAR